jgi:hypothetical protein
VGVGVAVCVGVGVGVGVAVCVEVGVGVGVCVGVEAGNGFHERPPPIAKANEGRTEITERTKAPPVSTDLVFIVNPPIFKHTKLHLDPECVTSDSGAGGWQRHA